MRSDRWDPKFDFERKTKFPVGSLVRCKAAMLTLWSDDNVMIGNLRRGDVGIVIEGLGTTNREAKLMTHIGVGWFDWDGLEAVQ
jgi:hypothetical protein